MLSITQRSEVTLYYNYPADSSVYPPVLSIVCRVQFSSQLTEFKFSSVLIRFNATRIRSGVPKNSELNRNRFSSWESIPRVCHFGKGLTTWYSNYQRVNLRLSHHSRRQKDDGSVGALRQCGDTL
mgnify:CR=1 FL=1